MYSLCAVCISTGLKSFKYKGEALFMALEEENRKIVIFLALRIISDEQHSTILSYQTWDNLFIL